MYEYKVVKVRRKKKAEEIMNEYARDGWQVKTTSSYDLVGLKIVFERKKK